MLKCPPKCPPVFSLKRTLDHLRTHDTHTRIRARAQEGGFEKTASASVHVSAVSASGTWLQVRMLAALHQAEALASNGASVTYCLEHAAAVNAVDRGALAAAWLLKIIECQRARVLVASMREADAEVSDTSAPSPRAHTVSSKRRTAADDDAA
jgi:hypothetical protein